MAKKKKQIKLPEGLITSLFMVVLGILFLVMKSGVIGLAVTILGIALLVSAVLDFDRTQYGFLWRDVGRAILSLCLREDEIDRAVKTAADAIACGVDALILQDVGLCRRIKAAIPA